MRDERQIIYELLSFTRYAAVSGNKRARQEIPSLQDTAAQSLVEQYAQQKPFEIIKMMERDKRLTNLFLKKIFGMGGGRVDKHHLMYMFFEYCENADLLIKADQMCANLNDQVDLEEWLKKKPSHPIGPSTELYWDGAYASARTNKQVIKMLAKNEFRLGDDSRFMRALFSDARKGFADCGEHDCLPYFFFLHRMKEQWYAENDEGEFEEYEEGDEDHF